MCAGAPSLAVVFVLLGSVATELRWGGRRNFTFARHKFLVVTVEELLKLVYFYQSYRTTLLQTNMAHVDWLIYWLIEDNNSINV